MINASVDIAAISARNDSTSVLASEFSHGDSKLSSTISDRFRTLSAAIAVFLGLSDPGGHPMP
jgi:hypothetical protein